MATAAQATDTRAEFLASAQRLFAEKGFYGASIAPIADELGLTKQALLHHFGSKERLYGEVLQNISDRFLALVEEAQSAELSAEAQLQAFCYAFYDAALGHVDESRVLMRELLDNKRRAENAGTWYLRPFLDALVAIARRTARWSQRSEAEALAGIYQLLGAVNYFAISEPTLAQMFGQPRFAAMKKAFPKELERLLQAQLAPAA